MDITASPSDRLRPASLWWGVPWPSDDDLQAEADTAWAIEVGLVDGGGFGGGGFDIEMPAPFDPVPSACADLAARAPSHPATCAPSDPAPCEPAPSEPAPSALSAPATPASSDRATLAPPDPVTLLGELEHHVRERHRATAAEYRLIRRAWAEGGLTDDDNLAPECRHHHRLRHETRWHPSRDPDTGDLRTSPLGAEVAEDPPPF